MMTQSDAPGRSYPPLIILAGAIFGAIGGGGLLTYLYCVMSSPSSIREAGIGWGIEILFIIFPINAGFGLLYGVTLTSAQLAQLKGQGKRASIICFATTAVVLLLYAVLHSLTGLPSPSGAHHISTVTTEPSTASQDAQDALSLCGPLFVSGLIFLRGCRLWLKSRLMQWNQGERYNQL